MSRFQSWKNSRQIYNMVYSNIHSSVFYKDVQTIDPEDVGHPATLFQMQLFGKMVLIVFGKVKHTFIDRNVVFFPIYLVSSGKIVGQIGLVEMHKNKVISLLQEDGDLDIENIDPPLLYDFVTETFIGRSGSDAEEFVLQKERGSKQGDKDDKQDDKQEDLSDEEDEVMKIKVPKDKLSPEIEKASETLDAGIFTKDAHIVPPPLLQEETKEEVATYKAEFKKHPSAAWIAKFMKNNGFAIHEVEANGDCFFAVVRDAYRQVGQITTVAKLRAILAKEVTEEIFEQYRGLYLSLDAVIRETDAEMSRIDDTIKNNLKKRAKKVSDDPEELQRILDQISELETEFKTLQAHRRETKDLLDTSVGSMKQYQTLEQFREFIQTPNFWANEWAISVLERALQMKVIIFSQLSYLEENYDTVLNCGMIDKEIEAAKQFRPKFYIMTTYNGYDHYRLITYKDKRIFVFHELSMHVKTLIINKCMEKSSGAFALITEFRNLKSKIGLEKEGEDTEDSDDGTNDGSEEDTDLYTKKIKFVFHITGNISAKPGKVSGELISEKERANFIDLGRIKEWRRKLDDAWTNSTFKVEGKKWASVEHYYQGAKFKKHFPDFMKLFSLDSDSEISKDVDLARIAGSKTGQPTSAKDKKKVKAGMSLRPSGVVIDPDFYGERSEQERETAVQAKFGQNADMRQLLLATKNAKLVHFMRGAEGETDHVLMKVRHELAR